ncbi:Uncharacterized protein DAT39_013352 [Clarias magur]|uniref:Uncharacterized protein n=1 Tax=Clarias magur TaxID=1594786 RepID=A0A8J4X855_CLAMG|nr:Uncharacterized protein DAT39_013352 [Clarias magur]
MGVLNKAIVRLSGRQVRSQYGTFGTTPHKYLRAGCSEMRDEHSGTGAEDVVSTQIPAENMFSAEVHGLDSDGIESSHGLSPQLTSGDAWTANQAGTDQLAQWPGSDPKRVFYLLQTTHTNIQFS